MVINKTKIPKLILSFLGITILLLVLTQYYFFLKFDFFDIRSKIFYFAVLISLLITSLVLFKCKSKLLIYSLLLLVLFSTIKPLDQYIIEYQTKKSFEAGNKIVKIIDTFYKKEGKYPSNINDVYKKPIPRYYIFLIPYKFIYTLNVNEFKISMKNYNGSFYYYYSSLGKWVQVD